MSGSYRIYRRTAPTGPDSLIATVNGGLAGYTYTGSPNEICWLHVKAVSETGREDLEPARLKRVAFDASGAFIGPAPNRPVGQVLSLGAAGLVTVSWRYETRNQAVAPAAFNIYLADADGTFSFASPNFQVTAGGSKFYSQSLGYFAADRLVQAIVRAESAAGVEDDNQVQAQLRVNLAAPAAANAVTAEVTNE